MDGGTAEHERGPAEDLMSRLTRRNARVLETRSRMRQLRGTGTAAEERVTVEVDPSGALVHLRIDPRAMRLGSEALAQAILEASERGVRDVRARLEEMTRPLVAELADTNLAVEGSAGAEFAGRDVDDVLAALRDVRAELRL